MKLTKKKVLVAALCVCLIAILSMGSLAWFTASDDITNNFYVGTTEDDDSGKDVFGIDVWETDDTGAKDDDGLEYTEILPGDVLHKDPTFTNTGVHPQFVRATVTVSDADIFMEVLGNDYADPNVLFKGINPNDWTFDGVSYVDGELKYVFYYNHVLAAKADTSALFTDVEIPLAMTLQQAQALTGDAFSVNIYGEAIQSENLGVNTAKEAFAQYQPEDLTYNGAGTVYLENKNITGEEIANITAPGEVRLVNATVDTETGLAVENGQNSTLMIVGGTYDVANGPVVSADAASSPVVLYLFGPVTVNGTVINSYSEAVASGAFENVTIIWMGNVSSYFN